jgi:cytochrome oxidase Cu insertion factor (SCO1/SenC/PrrC family)
MEPRAFAIALMLLSLSSICATVGHAQGGGEMIPVGKPFAEFELEAHDGTAVLSSALEGRPYLLFFYPKASTPG